VEIEIGLPPQGCQQNNHGMYWRVVAAAKAAYRLEAKVAGIGIGQRVECPCVVSMVFYCGLTPLERAYRAKRKRLGKLPKALYYRPLDKANGIGAMKSAIDGFVDAKVIEDDTHRHLSIGEVTILRAQKQHKGRSGVVLTFEAVRGAEAANV